MALAFGFLDREKGARGGVGTNLKREALSAMALISPYSRA